jgi:putative endonuclease
MQFPFLTGERLKPAPQHMVLGRKGEFIAADYLRSLGYDVRGQNIRLDRDEIDLLAWDPEDKVLVFAEVKTSTEKTRTGYHPEMRAGGQKRRALRRAARRWVADHAYDGGYRIDLLCVECGVVAHHFRELAW